MMAQGCDFDPFSAPSPACALGPFRDHGSVIISVNVYL